MLYEPLGKNDQAVDDDMPTDDDDDDVDDDRPKVILND